MKILSLLKNNVYVSVLAFLFFSMLTLALHYKSITTHTSDFDFGAEYGNIAASVAQGNGFANVFTDNSGPTAWHPPFNVYLMALVFSIFGIKSIASMWALLIFRNIIYAFAGYFLLKTAEKAGYARHKLLIIGTYLLLIAINFKLLMGRFDDVYSITFLCAFMVYAFLMMIRHKSVKSLYYLFGLAVLLPLTTPTMSLAFVILSVGYFVVLSLRLLQGREKALYGKNQLVAVEGRENFFSLIFKDVRLRAIVISGVIFVVALSGWSYRNYQVFGKFIPIKSNMWAEFYFANVLDDDGILSKAFFRKHHPIRGSDLFDQYLSDGEMSFIETCKEYSKRKLAEDPGDYLKRIGNRAFSALVFTDHIDDTQAAKTSLFTPEELAKLDEAQLLILNQWTSYAMDKPEFEQAIQGMRLQNEEAAINDWAKTKRSLYKRKYNLFHGGTGLFMALIPFLCLLTCLFIPRIRNSALFILTAVIYFADILPYLLVSHFFRYQLQLTALQAILMFLVGCVLLDALAPVFKRKKKVLQET